MGRRPLGRKYPKHISIQVKDQHNEDLKAMTNHLNQIATLSDKKWTIRDVLLTLLYGSVDFDSNWFINNHFEKITEKKLIDIRKKINESTVPQQKKKGLQLAINPEYQEYIDKVKGFSETLEDD